MQNSNARVYTHFRPYKKMADEEIVERIHEGDEKALDYLMNKYKNLVRAKARTYFLVGADREDIIQEGMIGLYKAVRDYRSDKTTSFNTFADLCVNRQMITAIKAATRQKHMPLNSYVSLNKPIFNEDNDNTVLLDMMMETKNINPEDVLIGQENLAFIEEHLEKSLSNLECEVLSLYLEGKSYEEIANHVGKTVKSIDNALQRVKKKLEIYLEEKNA
ncbi:MAG: RNA polymerase sporulation sigma factor SigH [Epulopiscium sp.]|nr:RNA polymerase sporulation sigma factor SigH [Candidatus Epulonipiscium sp.]